MTAQTTVSPGSSFTVPVSGVSQCRVTARGQAGSAGGNSSKAPGRGLLVQALLTVTSGQTLPVVAITGGAGGTRYSGSYFLGGKGGDGVSVNGVLFAPGGGGMSGENSLAAGGDGGTPNGADGSVSGYPGTSGSQGLGAAGSAGGTGGIYSSSYAVAGQSHASGGKGGAGGTGSSGATPGDGGGGGGGGYAGGGGGAGGGTGASGGGGSGFGGVAAGFNDTLTSDALFEVATAPLIPTLLSPIGNVYVDRTAPILLTIKHNGASADMLDAQTHWYIQYRAVGSGTWILDQADGVGNVSTIAANLLVNGQQYEWQAWTRSDGIDGPKSGIVTFRASNPPAVPVITNPANASTITDVNFTVDWTSVGQLEWQSRLIGDAAGTPNPGVVYDSAGAVSAVLTTPMRASTNSVAAHVQVRIRDVSGGLWSTWATVAVAVAWVGPLAPEPFTTSDPANGCIRIGWEQPAGGVAVDHYRIEVTEDGVRTGVQGLATVDPATREATFWTPRSGIPTALHVMAYAASGAYTDSTTGWSN